MTDRGVPPATVPISVAHVSPAAAASAPSAATSHNGFEVMKPVSAATVKTPPFARTWNASRASVFSTMLPIRALRAA